MSDTDIIAALEQSQTPLRPSEVADRLGTNAGIIHSRLSKLYQYGQVDRIRLAGTGTRYAYRPKRQA